MKIRFKFEDIKTQRDRFVIMMDMLHYGMYDDELMIGPFNINLFKAGIWVQGPSLSVKEFANDFESQLGRVKYSKAILNG